MSQSPRSPPQASISLSTSPGASSSTAKIVAQLTGDRNSWSYPASGGGSSPNPASGSTPRVVKSLVAEYEEVAKRIDEEAARSISRRASISSIGGRRSSFSHVVHVHGVRGEGKGGSGDVPRSSSERERDPDVYHSVFLDDPRHPESFQAQQLSGALIDPILLHGALENVSTITAGENARRERKGRRADAGLENSNGGGSGARPLSAASIGVTRQNSGKVSKKSSRRTSANPLRTSATSVGHGSAGGRHRPPGNGPGPIPIPPPRVASSTLATGLLNSPTQPNFPSGGANPGFVPGFVAELNAAAQAAQSHAGPSVARAAVPRTGSSSSSGAVAGPSSSPSLGLKKELSGSRRPGSGATRQRSTKSSRSDVGHASSSSSRMQGLNLPPMPEILPPRGSSMHHFVDTPQNSMASPPTTPPSLTSNRLSSVGRRTSSETKGPPSLGQVVQSVVDSSSSPGDFATDSPGGSILLQRRGINKTWEPLAISGEMGRQVQQPDGSFQESGSAGSVGASPRLAASPSATTVDEEEEEEQEEIRPEDDLQISSRWASSQHGGGDSIPHHHGHHQHSLSRVSNDSSNSGWTGVSEPLIIKSRARRGTFGSQRGSGIGSLPPVVTTNSSVDPASVGRPSFSSVRSSAWPHGGEGELLPSAASHGHGSRAASGSGSGTPNGAVSSNTRRSVSPQSPPSAALSPEYNAVRLSYGSSGMSSSSRNRESMFTARSSMSATNGHGLELDGISAQSHDVNSTMGDDYRAAKRGSGVPSVWIGPARAGDETEDGEEFFDAHSDEGDEGDEDSGEEQARRQQRRESEQPQQPQRSPSAQQRGRVNRLSKRSSVRSSVLSQPASIRNGHGSSRAPSPAKSAGTENHESDSAAAGHGSSVTLSGNPDAAYPAKTSDGLLLPPVLLSTPSSSPAIAPALAPESSSSSAPTPPSFQSPSSRRPVPVPPKRRSRIKVLPKETFEEDVQSSSNSSNEAANSYVRHSSLRPESTVASHKRSKHESPGSRQGPDYVRQRDPSAEDLTLRQGDVPVQAVVVDAEDQEQVKMEDEPGLVEPQTRFEEEQASSPSEPVPPPVPDFETPTQPLMPMPMPMKSLREREEIARAKTLRRLEKVEGASARRRQAEAEARAREATRTNGKSAIADLIDGRYSPQNSPEQRDSFQVRFDEGRMKAVAAEARAGVAPPNDFSADRGLADDTPVYVIGHSEDAATPTPDRLFMTPQAATTSPLGPVGRKSLDSKSARKSIFGDSSQRSPESTLLKRGSRGVEFAEMNLGGEGANGMHNTASLGRKKGLAALFGRSRRKSVAAPGSVSHGPPDVDTMPMPMPSPSLLAARRPSEPYVRIGKMVTPASPELGPVPSVSAPTQISSPSSSAQQHGLGFAFQEESPVSRSDIPADGRNTPSGRWRSRMPSMSSVRNPHQGRKSESTAPPLPGLISAEPVDEEWRRNLLADAVGLSLGLGPSKVPRSESRSGYRSNDERPETPMMRRSATPLPMDDDDPQETIKKSLSTPLLSDDLVDDGDESNKIDTLMMDLDNGLLIDAVGRRARSRTEGEKTGTTQMSVIERSASTFADLGGLARRIRGTPKSPFQRSNSTLPSPDLSAEMPSTSMEVPQARLQGGSAGPRVYSTILEDGPHRSRSETLWQRGNGGMETIDSLGVDVANPQMWPSEGGHGSAVGHTEMSGLRSGSQASLNGSGAWGNSVSYEGMDDGSAMVNHRAPIPSPVLESLGRMSRSVDHHHMSSPNGGGGSANGEHDWTGAASMQNHHSGSGGRAGGMNSRPSGMLSSLKARLRGRRQTESSPLGIGHVPLTNSQAVGHMAPGGMSSSYGYPNPNSTATSFQGHAQSSQQSFGAAQEATQRMMAAAAERDLSFTPSVTHSTLPPESPSASGFPASISGGKVSDGAADMYRPSFNERRNPYLVPPSPTGWSVGANVENMMTPLASVSAPGSNDHRRTSTSDLVAFDQMLRGYSAANNVLVRQIAARASSSNNHGSSMVSS